MMMPYRCWLKKFRRNCLRKTLLVREFSGLLAILKTIISLKSLLSYLLKTLNFSGAMYIQMNIHCALSIFASSRLLKYSQSHRALLCIYKWIYLNADLCICKCIYIKTNRSSFLTLTKVQAISSSSFMYIQMHMLVRRLMRMHMYIHYRIKYDTNPEVKAPETLNI